MARPPNVDPFFPLGALDYALEIREEFPEEAELLGVITILWNRHEEGLKKLFVTLLASKRPALAEAIWDRQSTHQNRRDLLALALTTAKLSKRQAGTLKWVIDHTKTVADRRNELIHAEYVIHMKTNKLHAKVRPPRSNKPAKHQPASASDLRTVANDLSFLIQATEAAWFEFATRSVRRLQRRLSEVLRDLESAQPPLKNRQIDSVLPTPRRKPRAE